jgi:MIP family channel proteins
MDASLDRRIVAEIVGTFGFFFAGFSGLAAAAVHRGSIDAQGQALCFGLGLTAMVFAFGHVSGGHYNPAVTLWLACGGRFPVKEVPFYWAAQLIGGLGAAGLVRGLWTSRAADQMPDAPAPGVSDGRAFLIEAVATFLFLLVISSVATDSAAPWHGLLAPVAIGGFIFTAATWAGPFTSCSFNPARSLAPSLVTGTYTSEWVFLLGPIVGGAAGGALFSFIRRPGTFLAPHQPPTVIDRRWADSAIDIPDDETEYEREAALARRPRHSHTARR